MTEEESVAHALSMGVDPNSPEMAEYRMQIRETTKKDAERRLKYAPLTYGVMGAVGGLVLGGLLSLANKKLLAPSVVVGTLGGIGFGFRFKHIVQQTRSD